MTFPPIPDTFIDAPKSRVILVPPDSSPLIATIAKKPDEQLDYDFYYTRWLAPTDTVASVVAAIAPLDPSVAIAGTLIDATGAIIKVWLQGGIGGMRYTVKLTATTAGGRVSEQIIVLSIIADRRASGDPEALADSAAASALVAADAALAASNSETNAGISEAAAAANAQATNADRLAADASASAAHDSEVLAGQHETAAGQSATDAGVSAGQASASAGASQQWATAAGIVGGIDYSAKYYAGQASTSAATASTKAANAATSETNASGWNTLAQAWASQAAGLVGGIDYSAKYYAGQAATSATNAAATLANALVKANNLSDVANATTARGNLSAAKSGANSDITSLSGLTTALSIAQGGTGGATAAAARTALGAAATGTDLSQFAATTSAQLAGVISDETGIGKLVFGTTPTLNQPNIVGNTTGSAAAAGSVGELLTASASGTSVPNSSSFNAVSLTLTPGVWDVSGAIQYLPTSVTSFNSIIAGISTVSGTLGAVGSNYVIQGALSSPGANHAPTPTLRVSVAANTPVYLVGTLAFTGGSCTANSTIRAARVI